MAIEKWTAGSGVGLSWTSCFNASDLNSLANGSCVLSSASAIANGTALDVFADLSVSLGPITPASPGYLSVFLYPRNQDGSSYGDGQFTAGIQSAAKTPGATYWVGNIVVPTGSPMALVGYLSRVILPPGTFLFCVQNNLGAALSVSSNAIRYWTYNRSVA